MKPRVLMIAYACDPAGGGEHWLGWGWAEQAAQSFTLDLITTTKAQEAVTAAGSKLGITPHFIGVPGWFRRITETFRWDWLRKLVWQRQVLRLAQQLHSAKPFDLVHQTTFHTFRVPFLASQLGCPSVWGPIAGGERVPPGFEHYLGSAAKSEPRRNAINRASLNFPSIKRSLQQSTALFVSNRTTLEFLPPVCRAKSQIVAPNSLRPQDEQYSAPPESSENSSPFKLLYIGNCVATRAIPIVLEALRTSGLADYELQIIGAGPALTDWQRRAAELGVASKVKFIGKVPYAELNKFYSTADVLVFPALRDSGGSALLEAMARYVPVICLDWAGPAEMVDDQSGIRIPVSNPSQTVKLFGEALVRLKENPSLRASLATAARKRALSHFGWPAKRDLLEATYRRLLKSP